MLSNDTFTVYRDLFGDIVIEKPLSGIIINKSTKINFYFQLFKLNTYIIND
jgi:hypothetical protein